jgi:hypothetical protein
MGEMIKILLKFCILVSALFAAGCGGGVSGSAPAAAKYVQLTFSLISSSQPRVGTFSVALTLPPGVSAPIKAGTVNELKLNESNGVLLTGTYSANQILFSGGKAEGMAYTNFAVINCPLSSTASSPGINDFQYSMSGVTIPTSPISDIKDRSQLVVKLVTDP